MSQRRGLTGLAFPAGGGLGWASPPGPLSTCGEGESCRPSFSLPRLSFPRKWESRAPRDELDALAEQIRRAYVSRWGNATV